VISADLLLQNCCQIAMQNYSNEVLLGTDGGVVASSTSDKHKIVEAGYLESTVHCYKPSHQLMFVLRLLETLGV
jgi:hypothetical protein